MLGLEDRLGKVREGFIADLLVVNGNPLENLKLLNPYGTDVMLLNGRPVSNYTPVGPGRSRAGRARRRHRVDDQGRHPVSRADAAARGAGTWSATRARAAKTTTPLTAERSAREQEAGVDAGAGRVGRHHRRRRRRVLQARSSIPTRSAPGGRSTQSVTTPRVLGPYAIEWPPTDYRDDVLGRLGGVFRGTVMQFDAGRGFFVADAFWLPPDGDPIGPMALEVTLTPTASTMRPTRPSPCTSCRPVSRRASGGAATTR